MPANSIRFSTVSVNRSGDWRINSVFIGNIVDPVNGTTCYTEAPPANSEHASPDWIWKASDNDIEPFGITFNFTKYGGQGESIQTAIGMVTVDPSSINGDANIEIRLVPCKIAGVSSNPQLAVTLVSGPAQVQPISGQPLYSLF